MSPLRGWRPVTSVVLMIASERGFSKFLILKSYTQRIRAGDALAQRQMDRRQCEQHGAQCNQSMRAQTCRLSFQLSVQADCAPHGCRRNQAQDDFADTRIINWTHLILLLET